MLQIQLKKNSTKNFNDKISETRFFNADTYRISIFVEAY